MVMESAVCELSACFIAAERIITSQSHHAEPQDERVLYADRLSSS